MEGSESGDQRKWLDYSDSGYGGGNLSAEIAKLGHVSVITPNLEKSLWFFRDVVGLEEVDHQEDTAFLKAWGDFEHHTLSLSPGLQAGVEHIGWRAKHPEDVDIFAKQFKARGMEVQEIEAGEEKGQGRAIRFQIPGDYPFEIYYDVEKPSAPDHKRSRLKSNVYRAWDHGISPRRIDHVNLHTTDAAKSHRWLKEEMGFKMREYIKLNNGVVAGGWMSVTPLVHDIAVMKDRKGQPSRFHHIAYFTDNFQDILRAADILREHDVSIDSGPGRHGISQAFFLYVRDPGSGLRIELFSGSYLIFDPDWEPIEWREHELDKGLTWWGAGSQPGGPMEETVECLKSQALKA